MKAAIDELAEKLVRQVKERRARENRRRDRRGPDKREAAVAPLD